MSDVTQKTLLIVDDDSVALRTMKEGLQEHYKIYGANSGANALKMLGKLQIDLVLLDYEMPEMNGPQTLQALKDDPATSALPVLFLSGAMIDEAQVQSLGANGFIKKGSAMDDIRAQIEAQIG